MQTDIDGNYLFTGLEPGNYQIKISDSNFAPGGALENASLSSIPTDTADNGQDGDDNGIQTGGLGTEVVSPIITLSAGDEPTAAETLPGGDLDDALNDANGDMTIDFGFVPTAAIGNLVFQDLDGDGLQDPEDFGVDGVGVTLIGGGTDGIIIDDPATPEDESADNTTVTTTTSGGFYFFDGLIPAVEYQVEFDETTLPFNTVFTQTNQGGNDELDSDANNNGLTDIITLNPGEFNETIDAGIVDTAGIGDLVFQDLNGNGIQDPEDFGVDGVGVTLIGGGADGIIVDDPATPEDESADNTTVTTTTSGGFYFFDGLIPAVEYQVEFDETTLPFNTVFTQTNQGGNDELDSDANNNGLTDIITLNPGEFNETIDAGIVDTAGIGDLVFQDLNGNGIQDPEDFGVDGVGVTLIGGGADGIIVDDPATPEDESADNTTVTTTTSGGFYFFDGLIPAVEYQVEFDETTLPFNTVFTQTNQGGNDELDSDANNNGLTDIITLNPGEFNETIDAGIVDTAGIGDLVFQDLNGNGIQDAEDFGVDGVGVTLIGGGTDGIIIDDPATPGVDESADNTTVTTTTSGGFYFFDGLIPAVEYQVEFDETTLPFNTVFTQTNQGGNDELDSDANNNGLTDIITLNPGEFNETIDAGIVDTAGIGDLVFQDLNGNGIQDAEDFGVDGVGVTLIGGGTDGIIIDDPATPGVDESADNTTVTTTTSGGFYFFDGLIPAVEYQVEFDETTLPFNTVFTQTNQGGNDELDSDANNNGLTDIITLNPGEFNETIDAGIREVLSIGSTVFTDENDNGFQDIDEAGISGVTVQLFDSTGTTEILVGADGILGTADDAAGGVTTDNNGNYFFDGLLEGDYRVVIPDSNFAAGGALTNTPLSSHFTNTNIENNPIDGDDNGIQTGGIGTEVTSPVISLLPGSEPLDSGVETAQGNNQDNLRDANGDMTVDFGFVPKNIVTGTGGSDVISPTTTDGTTAGNDFIIGGAGQDTLTGGDGSDCFHFNRTSDGIDIITDFNEGDVLDFSDMFAPGGELAGVTITNDPITDGYVEVVDANPSTLIQVDFDPNDALFNKNVVLLENVDSSTIDASDFIF